MNSNGMSGEFQTNREILRDIHSTVQKLSERSTKFESILLGDKEAERDGLVQTVKKHGKYISNDKKIKWIGIGLAGTTGAWLGFWDNIKHFLFK